MSGKAKSVYVSIVDSSSHRNVLQRTFYIAAEANKFMKAIETLEKYPPGKFYIVKETY